MYFLDPEFSVSIRLLCLYSWVCVRKPHCSFSYDAADFVFAIIFQLSFFQCRADDKIAVLLHLLKNVIKDGEQTVVFAATKHHVEYLNMVSKSFNKPILLSLCMRKPTVLGFGPCPTQTRLYSHSIKLEA